MSTDTNEFAEFTSEPEPEIKTDVAPPTVEQLRQLSAISPDENGKWPSAQKLFTHRLRREGRYQAYRERVDALVAEDKATGGSGIYPKWAKQAAEEFGIVGSAGEKIKAQEFIDSLKNPAITPVATHNITVEVRNNRSFEAMLALLPDKAARMTELEWIRHHTAMTRKARMKGGKLKEVTLAVKDLKDAPSKAAVIELQHWCNQPQEFFKKVLGETVKQKEETDSTKKKYDPSVDVAEIEALLRDLTAV